MGSRCLDCDYVGAVTTNTKHIIFDRTRYDVWIDVDDIDAKRHLVKLAAALGTEMSRARKLVRRDEPLAKSVLRGEVQRLVRYLKPWGIQIKTDPEFLGNLEGDVVT